MEPAHTHRAYYLDGVLEYCIFLLPAGIVQHIGTDRRAIRAGVWKKKSLEIILRRCVLWYLGGIDSNHHDMVRVSDLNH